MRSRLTIIAIGIGTFPELESVASAASGRLRGYWKFEQYGGGYCVDDFIPGFCEGARYLEEQYETAQPIRYGKMYVRDQNGTDIGTCSTNGVGYYDCAWTRSTMPSQIRATFRFEDDGLRFSLVGAGGSGGVLWNSGWHVVTDGENKYIGTLTMPKMGISQLFDAASRAWNDSFDSSFGLQAEFTGVELWAYEPSPCGGSSNICTEYETIQVKSAAKAYETYSVLHELGHVADYLLDPRDLIAFNGSIYCYPNSTGAPCTHSIDSEEWRGVARTEGFATFLALTAMYENDSPIVRSCFQDGDGQPCSASGIEFAEEDTDCGGDVGRIQYTSTRYFWDLYDSTNESGDAVTASLTTITSAVMETPVGYDFGENESFYAANGSTVDAWDSFHQWEWNENFEASSGINSSPVYYHNCLGYF